MTEHLPPPPISADVELKNFAYLPLDVQRLRDSDLALFCPGEAFKAAVLLWCVAWHQKPAASLPDDDRWLARHSGAGARWSRVKAEALRGFIRCSDGRLYHKVLVEKALEAAASKRAQTLRTTSARLRQTELRLEEAKSEGEREHLQSLIDGLRARLSQTISRSATDRVASPVTRTKGREGNRTEHNGMEWNGEGIGAPAVIKPSAQDVIDLWNEAAKRVNAELGRSEWPSVRGLTKDRRKAIVARLKDFGIENIRLALERAASDAWARGETPRPPAHADWHFGFDYFIGEKGFTKLLEKPPDDGRRPATGGQLQAFARGAMSIDETRIKGLLDR